MHRLIEFILGLPKGFLGHAGDYALQFNPAWPGQDLVGASTWNLLLIVALAWLIVHVYRREGHRKDVRIALGVLRGLLAGFTLLLLNRPTLTLTQVQREPSVVAVLLDDTISMRVHDGDSNGQSRFDAAMQLLGSKGRALLEKLSHDHQIKLYRFDRDAQPMADIDAPSDLPAAEALLAKLQPIGQTTQVLRSVHSALDDLQSRRLAGVVVLTDGRDVPIEPLSEGLEPLKSYGVTIFTVPIGSDAAPRNIAVEGLDLEPSAFKDDYTSVKITVRCSGYGDNHPVTITLKNKQTGEPLKDDDNADISQTFNLPDDKATDVEMQFKPHEVGPLDLAVEAIPQPGEITDDDNIRTAQVQVLDTQIALLYVDGYPRWDYRYLKNSMLRDKTIQLSCLLTSADPSFRQEGTKPITRFPESIEELMDYDVIIFGDVDPDQFTDAQLQLVSQFVAEKGGGFGMVAGPRWSPQAYRNTPIEPILPVNISRVETDSSHAAITEGFRPVLTRVGEQSSIFRFFEDREKNAAYLRNQIAPLFWYCHGVTAKPGVGEVYAEHPTDIGPDGRKAPLLVLGRFGAGRTLFSAIDDSWRWRFYTGESIFNTYWLEQLRYLARSKKLGQRKLTFTASAPEYQLGEQIRLQARVLDPSLIAQLPDQISVAIADESGKIISQQTMQRQTGQPDLFAVSFAADTLGHLTARLPRIVGDVEALELPIDVEAPRQELADPRVDRTLLTALGPTVEYNVAADQLPKLIHSAAKNIPVDTARPLWDAPLAMAVLMTLLIAEWLLRKANGMV